MNQQTSEHDDDIAVIDADLFKNDPISEGLCQYVAGIESITDEVESEGGMTRDTAERLNDAAGDTVADPYDFPESFPIQDGVQPALEAAFKRAWAKIKEMWDRFTQWLKRMMGAIFNMVSRLSDNRRWDKLTREKIAAAKAGIVELIDIAGQISKRSDVEKILSKEVLPLDNNILETSPTDPNGAQCTPFVPPNSAAVTAIGQRLRVLFRDYSPVRVGMREGEELKTYLSNLTDQVCKVIGDNYPAFKNNGYDSLHAIVEEKYSTVMSYPAKGDRWLTLTTINKVDNVNGIVERMKAAKVSLDASPTFAVSTYSPDLIPSNIEREINLPWSRAKAEDHPGAAAVCIEMARVTGLLSRIGTMVARAIAYSMRGGTYVYSTAERIRKGQSAIRNALADDEVLLNKIIGFGARYKN